VSVSIKRIAMWLKPNAWIRPRITRFWITEQTRKMAPQMNPIACNLRSEPRTTSPAIWDVGKAENAVAATTGKNRSAPSHAARASSIRKRRMFMLKMVTVRDARSESEIFDSQRLQKRETQTPARLEGADWIAPNFLGREGECCRA